MKDDKELEVITSEVYALMQSRGVTWREMDLILSGLHELRKQAAGFDEIMKRLQELQL